jgi:hypothetical protein
LTDDYTLKDFSISETTEISLQYFLERGNDYPSKLIVFRINEGSNGFKDLLTIKRNTVNNVEFVSDQETHISSGISLFQAQVNKTAMISASISYD